ncbi:hypothetical protein BDB01DRAFT_830477 [Pilobolus umbonatus]|nr:hypothetical protein BDB01DRAFT_830477 [Pilobolus umbonatus]
MSTLIHIPQLILQSKHNLYEKQLATLCVMMNSFMYAINYTEQVELIYIEITDGYHSIPALFRSDLIDKHYGIDNIKNGTVELTRKWIQINESMVGLCKRAGHFVPYLAVIDFIPTENNQCIETVDDIYEHTDIRLWLDNLNYQHILIPLSTLYSADVTSTYSNQYCALETMLEWILSSQVTEVQHSQAEPVIHEPPPKLNRLARKRLLERSLKTAGHIEKVENTLPPEQSSQPSLLESTEDAFEKARVLYNLRTNFIDEGIQTSLPAE